MISRLRLTFAVSTFVVCSSWGQQGWEASSRKDIESMLSDYNTAFIRKDYEKLRDVLQVPFIRVNDRETAAVKTLDEVIESYRRAREPLDARGYKTSRLALPEARISVLSASRALVNLSYSRYKTDGSLLEQGAAFYLVSKSSGKWKLCGILSQDPTQAAQVH